MRRTNSVATYEGSRRLSLQVSAESELLAYRTTLLDELIGRLIDMAVAGNYSPQLFIRCLRVLAIVPQASGTQSSMANRIESAMRHCAQRDFTAAAFELRKAQSHF